MVNETIYVNINNRKYFIKVNGGDDYSTTQKEHDPPHFHLFDNKTNHTYEIKIGIPSVDEWKNDKSLKFDIVYGYINNEVYKDIDIWVNGSYFLDEKLTNLEFLRKEWNYKNYNNSITTKFSVIMDKNIIDEKITDKVIKRFNNYSIIVKGGYKYILDSGVGRNPHFYLKFDNGSEIISFIPKKEEWEENKYLTGVYGDVFKDLKKVYEELIEYFSKNNNLEKVSNVWNDLNKNNNFVFKI